MVKKEKEEDEEDKHHYNNLYRLNHEKSIFKRSQAEHFKSIKYAQENDLDASLELLHVEEKSAKFLYNTRIRKPLYSMVVRGDRKTLDAKKMVNKSNDCFFNSTMQVLLSIDAFIDQIQQYEAKGYVCIAFKEFISQYVADRIVDPKIFISKLKMKMKIFNGQEQDAHEFLVNFLHILYCEMGGNNKTIDQVAKMDTLQENNMIAKYFYGMQKETIVCKNNHRLPDKFQEISILTLPVKRTILDAYQDYVKNDKLSYQCDKCKKCTEGNKSTEIVKFPKILIVHLRRFLGNSTKDDLRVSVDIDLKFGDIRYHLIGSILHHGHLNGGHYYSYAKRKQEWWKFDDASVEKVASSKVDHSDAYILFYMRF